jgi:Glycogen recognition site of AMP-activated protein kinase
MAKKSFKKATKQLAPEAGARQPDRPYPAAPTELDDQRQRLKQAAAAGAQAINTPAPAASASAAASSKPLTPLAAIWPDPASAQQKPRPSQAPGGPAEAQPAKTVAPQRASAPSAQPALLPMKSEPMRPPARISPAAQASRPPEPRTVKVTFVLPEPAAQRVALGSEFNGWSPDATPMKRHADGHWETTVTLAPGRYQYKFIVDGQWIPDPRARENILSPLGTLNSVIEVRA